MADPLEIIARHYRTGEGHSIIFSEGIIESIDPAEAPENIWYGSGVFDPQVNGYAGIDIQNDGLTTEELCMASDGLKADGCPQELDRHDNFLWRIFHRVLGPENIYYTTDAMSAAGAPPGRYTVGRLDIEVGEDQIVRHPGKPTLPARP